MIVDHISHWRRYGFGPEWETFMTRLEDYGRDPASVEDGTHPLPGSFINVTSLTSRLRAACRYEYHRRFCDVHMVLEGKEWLFNAPALGLTPDGDFDAQKDLGFFSPAPAEITRVTLAPGMFALIFPWEAHLPAIAPDDAAAPLRKCVGKIPLDSLRLS